MRWLVLFLMVATRVLFTGAIPDAPPRTALALEMLYNGTDLDGPYAIGAATSDDGGVTWTPAGGNPVISLGAGGAWDDSHVKDPMLLWDGSQYVVYYSGHDGSNWRTGRATASSVAGPWTKYGSNPVMGLGSTGAFDEDFAAYPVILYEPAESPPWKMWYSAVKDDEVSIGHADSTDGLTWTKRGQVLTVGAVGQWDDEDVGPAAIYRYGDTYYLFYHGTQAAANPRSQVGLVTFTDPQGTYTRHASNPVIKARFNDAGTSQGLTADTGTGSSTVTVASTSAFNVGEAVVLADGNSQTETHEVESIDSGTQITLVGAATAAFTVAAGAILRPFAYNGVGARTVRHDTSGWVMYGSAIQPVEDLSPGGSKLREGVMRWTAPALAGPWSYDYTAGLIFPLYPFNGGWSDISSEHPSVVPAH